MVEQTVVGVPEDFLEEMPPKLSVKMNHDHWGYHSEEPPGSSAQEFDL